MNKYLRRKKIFTLIFLTSVFGFSIINLLSNYQVIISKINLEDLSIKEMKSVVQNIESNIDKEILWRHNMLEINALTAKILDKKEINNFKYIKDEDGYLHDVSFFEEKNSDVFSYAQRVKRLQDSVADKNTKVLFALTPSKYSTQYTNVRDGMLISNKEGIMDELLRDLTRLGVETLDLREFLPLEGQSHNEMFFKSDHHWNITTTYDATQILAECLNQRFNAGLSTNKYLSKDSYIPITYPKTMLGSGGRRTGASYVEVEDFTALWPIHLDQDFTRRVTKLDGEITTEKGNFIEALMTPEVLVRGDVYTSSAYGVYLSSITHHETIENNSNPEGPTMLMIRDSYFSPVMAFMAPLLSRIDSIWALEALPEISVEKLLNENTYDYVVIELYYGNIGEESFNYFKESKKDVEVKNDN